MTATASCHCGACVIELAEAPAEVADCNCSICRRYGTLWAYYRLSEVDLSRLGPTDTYVWGDRMLAFHRCAECGCVTHWASFDNDRDRMGVNARLLPPEVLAAASVRFLDNAG